MNGVQRAYGFSGEWLASPIHHFIGHADDLPVSGHGDEVGAAVRCFGFGQLPQSSGTQQYPIAFNESEIRCHHHLGSIQLVENILGGSLVQQPGKNGA